MQEFLSRHSDRVMGVISGFDRIVFRGHLSNLMFSAAMEIFLNRVGVLRKDFGAYARGCTDELKSASLAKVEELGRPYRYLTSSRHRKEDIVRRIQADSPVYEGLICVLSCVEPCMTYNLHRSREERRLIFQLRPGKCQHLYHYFQHPRFGIMHVRLQTWFPFTVQICMNGREWLAKDLTKAGIDFVKHDNCFPFIEDIPRAQRLLSKQVKLDWPRVLDRLVLQVSPALPSIVQVKRPEHYWCAHQIEWATDVMFGDPADIARIYKPLVRHAMTHFSSGDVMRFLGRKVHGAFEGEIVSDFKNRPEGIRIKHSVGRNSVKVYDKAGSILRVETTVNDPSMLRAIRPNANTGELALQPIRKTVADLERSTEVSQRANERYLDALAELDQEKPLHDVLDPVCKHTTFRGRRVRALKPWDSDDIDLFVAINNGDFVLRGFRNGDIVDGLYTRPAVDDKEKRRRRSRVSRLLRILRAHGMIRKLPKQNRYQVSPKGRQIVTAVLAARDTPVAVLLNAA